MSVSTPLNPINDDSSTLSNSLLNDSSFWRNFLRDDEQITEDPQSCSKISKCDSVSVSREIDHDAKQVQHSTVTNDYSHLSTCEPSRYLERYKRKVSYNSKLKECKYNTKHVSYRLSSNSYLYKIKCHVENCVKNKIPVLVIKDISKAKRYSIFNELSCEDLYEVNRIVFQNVICRAIIVGLTRQGDIYRVLLDDGTGSMWCTFKETPSQTEDVEILPIPYDSQKPSYRVVTSFSDLERGITVQVFGNLNTYHKTITIKKMYREDGVIVRRELSYLRYVQGLHEKYERWREDILNIFKI